MTTINAENITSFFLYGAENPPDSIATDALIRPEGATTTIDVDVVEFMKDGAGRFATPDNFDVVQFFFDENIQIPAGSYSKSEFREEIFKQPSITFNMSQRRYDDGKADYVERSYIWNTMTFQLNDNEDLHFVVTEDGKRYLENVSTHPRDFKENFNFIGGKNTTTTLANKYLQPRIDPSRIGKTVAIEFTGEGDLPIIPVYDEKDFRADRARSESWAVSETLASTRLGGAVINGFTQDLFDKGITRFLDADDRPILYGTPDNNVLEQRSVENFPTLDDYFDNGVVLFGGDGDDSLTGTTYASTLTALDPQNDILVGGKGNDTLIGAAPLTVLGGSTQVDTLTGGTESDTFIIEGRYQSGINEEFKLDERNASIFEDYALITDFEQDIDTLVVEDNYLNFPVPNASGGYSRGIIIDKNENGIADKGDQGVAILTDNLTEDDPLFQ